MVVGEAAQAFSSLDTSGCGSLGVAELRKQHAKLWGTDISPEHVEASIARVCGSRAAAVGLKEFLPVLEEMQRRAAIEETARWDFCGLSMNGFGTIGLEQALFLFKMVHGSLFSVDSWNSFLAGRADPSSNVCWEELRMPLCEVPIHLTEDGRSEASYYTALSRAALMSAEGCASTVKRKRQDMEEQHRDILSSDREGYADATRARARAKLFRWEDEGLKSVLDDGGKKSVSDMEYVRRTRRSPAATELLEAVEEKYGALRKRLLRSLARLQQGEITWDLLTDWEQEEVCGKLEVAEKKMRRLQSADLMSALSCLPDSTLPFSTPDGYVNLQGILGSLSTAGTTASSLKLRGQRSDDQLAGLPSTYGAMVAELNAREEAERQTILSSRHAAREIGDTLLGLDDYCCLRWQLLAIQSHDSFEAAALAVGIRERAAKALKDDAVRQKDRGQYENLSRRLIDEKSSILYEVSDGTFKASQPQASRGLRGILGRVEILEEIMYTFAAKHQAERVELLKIVQRPTFTKAKLWPLPKSPLERASAMAILRGRRTRWQESAHLHREDERALEHSTILEEAVAMYFNEAKRKMAADGKEITERSTLISVMADLLEEQELEVSRVLEDLLDKDVAELKEFYTAQENARCLGFYDNIALLTIGEVALVSAEQLMSDQLQLKYDCLRMRLMEYSLLAEYGAGWLGRSDVDQQQLLSQREAIYKKHVREGALDEAEKLLGDAIFDFSVHHLLGENRADYAARLSALAADPGNAVPEKEPQQTNIEATLQNRFFAERTALLDLMHSGKADAGLLLVCVGLEVFLVTDAADYLSAAYGVGLLERALPGTIARHAEDRERMLKLSKVHIDNHQQRHRMRLKYAKKPLNLPSLPRHDDKSAWLELATKVMMRKHADERDTLLQMLSDSSLQELCHVAAAMTVEEHQRRLVELQNKQRWLLINSEDVHHENVNILEEAAAIKWVMLKNEAIRRDEVLTDNELMANILFTLIELQHQELASHLAAADAKSASDLSAAYYDQCSARKWDTCRNVCAALTMYEGRWSNAELERLLKIKYERLESKFVETVVSDHEPDWSTFTANQRADKISQFHAQAEQLRSEGSSTELATLYQTFGVDPLEFVNIFGDNQFEFLRKLLHSLKLQVHHAEMDAAGLAEERSVDGDLIVVLRHRHAEERQCLAHMLQGVHGLFWGESGRIAEAIRLQHQAAVCSILDTVTEAGHYCGLLDRIQMIVNLTSNDGARRQYMLEGDWDRLVELGQELLLKLDERKNVKWLPKIVEVPPGSDHKVLLETVFQLLLLRQSQEARSLHSILTTLPKERVATAAKLSKSSRYMKLAVLKQKADSLSPNDSVKRNEYLNVAAALKLAASSERAAVTKATGNLATGATKPEEEAIASVLAELIEAQLFELASQLKAFNEQDEDELMAVQARLVSQLKTTSVPGVLEVMLRASRLPRQKQHELADAVHSKYEVAQDKLLLQALTKRFGTEWQEMDAQLKQEKLSELRDQVKELQAHGKKAELKALVDSRISLPLGLIENGTSIMHALQDWCAEEVTVRLRKLSAEQASDSEIASDESGADSNWNHELDELRRERRLVGHEAGAEACVALVLLLSARNDPAETQRLRMILARERAMLLRNGSQKHTDWTDDNAGVTAEGDTVALIDDIAESVELRHRNERETMALLVTECEDKFSTSMTDVERSRGLAGLAELRWRLLHTLRLHQATHIAILKEAVGYHCSARIVGLQLSTNGANQAEAALQLTVSFLADLDLLHEKEKRNVVTSMAGKASRALVRMLSLYRVAQHRQWNDNIAAVLLPAVPAELASAADVASNDKNEAMQSLTAAIVAAVEGKFEAAQDLLLLECMRRQRSAADWLALSDADRQLLIMNFKSKLEELRLSGKVEDAYAMLQQLLTFNDCDAERRTRLCVIKRQQLAAEAGVPEQEISDADVQASIQQQEAEEGSRRCEVYATLESHMASEKTRMAAVASDEDAPLLLVWLRLERSRAVMAANSGRWDDKSVDATVEAVLALAAEHEPSDVMTSFPTGDAEDQLKLAEQQLGEMLDTSKNFESPKESKLPPLQRHARSLVTVLACGKEARAILQEALVEAVHIKHDAERKLFARLLQYVVDNQEMLRQTVHLGLAKILKALEKLETELLSWEKSHRDSLGSGTALSSSSQEEQLVLLQKAMLYRTMVEVYHSEELAGDSAADPVAETRAIFVAMLADVRSFQAAEERSINEVLLVENNEVIEELLGVYTSAQLVVWVDNVAAGLLHVMDDADKWETQTRRMKVEDRQYQAEKQRVLDQMIMHGIRTVTIDGQELDAMEHLKNMELNQMAHKQSGMAEAEKQKSSHAVRRAARVLEQRQNSQGVRAAALALQLVASREEEQETETAGITASDLKIKQDERAKRLDKMKEKLAERQFMRGKMLHVERLGSGIRSRSGSPNSQGSAKTREGSHVQKSNENAEEILGKMVREHSRVKEKLTAEEKKQQDLIKKKRDTMKAQKENEVISLLNLGERQKTTLEKSRREDRSRQDTMVEERITRIRSEKTLTGKSSSTSEKKFADMVDTTVDGADRDEKMAALAQELEQKLRAQESSLHHGRDAKEEDSDQFQQENVLADEERLRIIKEKRAMKRLKRRESFSQL